jgi:hypothetical protein
VEVLTLNVPPLTKRVLSEIELRPTRVGKLVAELPMLNVAETSRKLFSMLNVNNRIDIEDHVRLELLELYRKPAHDLSVELQKLYFGQPLPLSDRQKIAAEQNRQFQIEMAFGYKRVVLNGARGPATGERPLHETALAIQRAIRHLGEAIAISYEIYSPYPLGLWQEIHTLYRHAESLGVTDVQIEDALNKTTPTTSVAHVYKQALLVDMADPYHLPARLTQKVQHYLDRWASLATILPATQTYDPTCQFLISQHSDHAGIANTQETKIERPEQYRLLNTVELARLVHMHLTTLTGGNKPEPEGLDSLFFGEEATELLRRLINAWGLHPKRTFRRSQRADEKMDVSVGIDAINYALNGGSRFVVSSTFVGPIPQRTAVGAEKKSLHIEQPELDCVTWNVLDESAGGFSLAHQGAIRTRVRIGDLIAVRKPGVMNSWSISAIRWARSASSSEVEFGAQRIAPTAEPVVIKLITDQGKESDFLPALRLPENRALSQAASLITHRGVYRPNRDLYLDDGSRLYHIVTTQALEITSAFERFQFRLLSV